MEKIKNFFNKITNGTMLIIIGFMHTSYALSGDGFGKQFAEFSKSGFFKISKGAEVLPAAMNSSDLLSGLAFWFFYFGILLIPIGLLVHSLEKEKRALPHSFTVSYLIVVIIGCYMIPNSGITFFMLPHAIYMFIRNFFKAQKVVDDYVV